MLVLLLLVGLCFAAHHRLTAADDTKTLLVAQGDTVTLELTTNPSTGFSWTCTHSKPILKIQSDETLSPSTPNIVGAPTTRVIRLAPVDTGLAEVKCRYLRPWMEKDNLAQTVTFTLVVVTSLPSEEAH